MELLLVGSALGAVIGLLHAGFVCRERLSAGAGRGRALYYALWTLALWTLFGSYVLVLWLVAVALYLPVVAFKAVAARPAGG